MVQPNEAGPHALALLALPGGGPSAPLIVSSDAASRHAPLTCGRYERTDRLSSRGQLRVTHFAAKGVEGAVCVCPLVYAAFRAVSRRSAPAPRCPQRDRRADAEA